MSNREEERERKIAFLTTKIHETLSSFRGTKNTEEMHDAVKNTLETFLVSQGLHIEVQVQQDPNDPTLLYVTALGVSLEDAIRDFCYNTFPNTMKALMDSRKDTMDHKSRVFNLMVDMARELLARSQAHDSSKLCSPEKEIFDEFTPKLATSTYGSEEYKGFLKAMGPALEHHYAENRHHPEHFGAAGVAGMTLVDLIEMLCDWKAASERHKDGNILKSIEMNMERFSMSAQLTTILMNTARELFE